MGELCCAAATPACQALVHTASSVKEKGVLEPVKVPLKAMFTKVRASLIVLIYPAYLIALLSTELTKKTFGSPECSLQLR